MPFLLAVWEITHHFMDKYTASPTFNNFLSLKEIMMKVLDTDSIKIDGIAKTKAA